MAIGKNIIVTHQCKPAVPFEAEYPLTLADVAITPGVNSRYLLAYQAPEDPSYQDYLIERLKRALESLLAEPEEGILALPEILGKIHSNAITNKHVVKVCKDSSVRFVVSHRNDYTYEMLEPHKGFPMRCLKGSIFATGLENVPTPDKNGGIEAFSSQITFIRGGFVICVSKHHFLIDGTAISNMMKWWFKKARSYLSDLKQDDTSILPASKLMEIHNRDSLLMDSNVEIQEHPEWKVVPGSAPSVFGVVPPSKTVMTIARFLPSFLVPKIVNAIFRFSPASLKEIHADVQKHTKKRISTNDAVCALLWRCVTRARLFSHDQAPRPEHSSLVMAVNGRRKLEPPLVDEYFGNCAFFAPSSVPVGVLTSMGSVSLSDVAEAIRESLMTRASNTHFRSLLQIAKQQDKITDMVMAFNVFMGHDLMVTSWERFFDSLDELDVGAGVFKRLRLPDGGAFDGLAMVMPAFGLRGGREADAPDDYMGGLEISLDLLAAPMENLKADTEWQRYTRWTEADDADE
jgi:hypothetical protein